MSEVLGGARLQSAATDIVIEVPYDQYDQTYSLSGYPYQGNNKTRKAYSYTIHLDEAEKLLAELGEAVKQAHKLQDFFNL